MNNAPTPYPLGTRITFIDPNGNTRRGSTSISTGLVNGPALPDDDGLPEFLPCWCARDNGREHTTIYIHVSNILDTKE